MTQSNLDIRTKIESNGLKKWEVATEVGIADATFSRWLRHELIGEKRERVLAAIDKLASEKEREQA